MILWMIILCGGIGMMMYSSKRKNISHQDSRTKQNVAIQILINITDELRSQTSPEDTIFVISRSVQGGPPVMVKKLKGNAYPYSVVLTQEDKMIATSVIVEPLNISIKVDKDGNASTQGVLDLIGIYSKNPVGLESGIHTITVDRRIGS